MIQEKPVSNQSDIVNEEHERSIKLMQITHELSNKQMGVNFSKDEIDLYGHPIFGPIYWHHVGGWVQDEYTPFVKAKQDTRAAIAILFHRAENADGSRRFKSQEDYEFLQNFPHTAIIFKLSLAILQTDKNPSGDSYVVLEDEVTEQLKNS